MDALEPTLKHWYAYQLIYPFALFFVKASILALYHRLFRKKQFRYWLWVVAGIVTVYTVVVVFVNVRSLGIQQLIHLLMLREE